MQKKIKINKIIYKVSRKKKKKKKKKKKQKN